MAIRLPSSNRNRVSRRSGTVLGAAPFRTVLYLCFAGLITAAPASADRVSCKYWIDGGLLTIELFRQDNDADVARCLRAGADPNAQSMKDPLGLDPDYGETRLGLAARLNSNPAVVIALLEAGADPNGRDDGGWTPLHSAAGNDDNPEEIIAALVERGADPNARGKELDATPLHSAAADNGNPGAIVALLKAGADPNAQITNEQFVEEIPILGKTPLHLAVIVNDNPEVITALVAGGADPNVRDGAGVTPIQEASNKNDPALIEAFKREVVAAFRAKQRQAEDNQQQAAAVAERRQVEERLQSARVSCDKWNTSEFFRHAIAADVSRCLRSKDPNARGNYSPMLSTARPARAI